MPSVTVKFLLASGTTSTTFQELAERIQGYIRDKMPEWKTAMLSTYLR